MWCPVNDEGAASHGQQNAHGAKDRRDLTDQDHAQSQTDNRFVCVDRTEDGEIGRAQRRDEQDVPGHRQHRAREHVSPETRAESGPRRGKGERQNGQRHDSVHNPDHDDRVDRTLCQPLLEDVRDGIRDDPDEHDKSGQHAH